MTLPDGWIETTLGEVSEKPQYGWTSKATERGDGLRLLRTTDITRGSVNWGTVPFCDVEPPDPEKYLLAPDDILISRAGSVGFSTRLRGQLPRGVFASYLIRFRASKAVSPAYLECFLKSPSYWAQIGQAAVGIALANINAKKLAAVGLPLPPLAEQRRIVGAIEEQFSRLDAVECSLEAALRRAGSMREALLDSAAMQEPTLELGALVTDLRYGTSTKCDYAGTGAPVLRIPNVHRGTIDTTDLKYAIDTDLDLTSHVVSDGDVLFVRTNGSRNLIGRAAAVERVDAGTAFASYLIRARLDCTRVSPKFVSLIMAAPSQRRRIERLAATSAGQYNLNLKSLRSLPVPDLPIEEQRRIVAELEQQLSLIDSLRAAVESAQKRSAALRRAILERAFRGELVPQVPDDEPASVLLERIRAERERAPDANCGRRARA